MASNLPKTSNGAVNIAKLTKSLFIKAIEDVRSIEAQAADHLDSIKDRCRFLSVREEIEPNSKGVLYWMTRDYRVQDNWSMIYAQQLAREHKLPLYVCVFTKPFAELHPTKRQYNFLIKSLKGVKEECDGLNIQFLLLDNDATEYLAPFVFKNKIGAVITDFFPLQIPKMCLSVANHLSVDVVVIEVDAHNIVPAWVASEKREFAARTLRPKIYKNFKKFFTGFPAVTKHEYSDKLKELNYVSTFEKVMEEYSSPLGVDLAEVTWAKPGCNAGLEKLYDFIINRLQSYAKFNCDPSKDALSNLSPWLHFGNISAQRCALEVKNFEKNYKDHVDKFLEELIVRRELSDNYCLYEESYKSFEAADDWAYATLDKHRKDVREYVYTEEQFTKAATHDELWNAAQIQLLQDGKIHSYMRMYWCKKILEWSDSPEKAIEIAVNLNDIYSIDGSDPNGYVGIMWSICGLHDHPWGERPVYGKVRCMMLWSTGKKFDSVAYCARYGRTLTIGKKPKTKQEDPVDNSKRMKKVESPKTTEPPKTKKNRRNLK